MTTRLKYFQMPDMTGYATAQDISTEINPLNFLQGKLLDVASSLPEDVKAMTEVELWKSGKITKNDYFLRRNLWKSIEIAQKTGQNAITQESIYHDVVSAQNFNSRVMTSPHRIAYLLMKPTLAREQMEEALHHGMMRLRNELLTMPIDEKTAPVFLKALEFLANRTWGPVIQKIQAQHAHLNMNKPIAIPAVEQLKELQAKALESRDVSDVVEVKAE